MQIACSAQKPWDLGCQLSQTLFPSENLQSTDSKWVECLQLRKLKFTSFDSWDSVSPQRISNLPGTVITGTSHTCQTCHRRLYPAEPSAPSGLRCRGEDDGAVDRGEGLGAVFWAVMALHWFHPQPSRNGVMGKRGDLCPMGLKLQSVLGLVLENCHFQRNRLLGSLRIGR